MVCELRSNRLLKNAHLLCCPARSPSRGRAKSCSLLVATAPFVVATYSLVRLRPAHQLAGVAGSRSLFVATPLSGFRALP